MVHRKRFTTSTFSTISVSRPQDSERSVDNLRSPRKVTEPRTVLKPPRDSSRHLYGFFFLLGSYRLPRGERDPLKYKHERVLRV